MRYLSNITRTPGDPQVISTGPSSMGATDQLAKALGWFSIGLGMLELFAPRSITRALGVEGNEGLVRAFGAREIGSGLLSLSIDKQVGLWSRVAGDGLDLVTVASAYRQDNPQRDNVGLALIILTGVALLDIIGAQGTTVRHSRQTGGWRDYSDRSGFPKGLPRSREAAASQTGRRQAQPSRA